MDEFILTFGKYKGEKIDDVMKKDFSYIALLSASENKEIKQLIKRYNKYIFDTKKCK